MPKPTIFDDKTHRQLRESEWRIRRAIATLRTVRLALHPNPDLFDVSDDLMPIADVRDTLFTLQHLEADLQETHSRLAVVLGPTRRLRSTPHLVSCETATEAGL